MTIEEKLDLIISLLQEGRQPVRAAADSDDDMKPAVLCWLDTVKPRGFVAAAEIARQCFLDQDKATVQALGRVLDSMGKKRAKSGSHRGFRF